MGLRFLFPPSFHQSLAVDGRDTVQQLKAVIFSAIEPALSLDSDCDGGGMAQLRLHSLLDVGDGVYHILQEYGETREDQHTVAAAGIRDQFVLLAWNGTTIDGLTVAVGEEHTPLRLHVLRLGAGAATAGETEFSLLLPQSTTIKQLRATLAEQAGIELRYLLLHWLDRPAPKGNGPLHLGTEESGQTLRALGFASGATLAIEVAGTGEAPAANTVFAQRQRALCLKIETRQCGLRDGRPLSFEAEKGMTARELKQRIFELLDLTSVAPQATRLRVLDDHAQADDMGWLVLHERQALSDLGIKPHNTVYVEPGTLPDVQSRLILRFRVGQTPSPGPHGNASETRAREVIVERSATLQEVIQTMKAAAGISEGEWHACRTNWYVDNGGIKQKNRREFTFRLL